MSDEPMEFCLKMSPCKCGSGSGEGAKLPDLSYEEQYAGYHDVDGKKVYTKLVDLGQMFDAIPGQKKSVDPQIPSVLNIIDLKVRRYNDSGEIVFGNLSRPETNWEVSFYIAHNQIIIQVYGNASGNVAIAQIFYTCTDR